MAGTWKEVPISTKLFTNVRETVLRKAQAAIENAFINEAGGHSRFPGMSTFCTLAGGAPTYLDEWKGDLLAVTNSRIYRVDKSATARDVTGVPLSGEGRAHFSETDNEKLIAAGGPILRLAGAETEILSADAPNSTHTGYIDGYVIAIETGSGRFQHCDQDDFRVWDALNTFAANGKPDDLNGLIITDFREVILTGTDSVEQYERLTSGATPFFRRWGVGEGILAPYTLVFEDQGVWAVNKDYEFVRFSGQVSDPNSDDLGRDFEQIDDWTHAWAVALRILGQKFILLQIPFATNVHGTKGVTLLFDFRSKKWTSLFGWDANIGQPTRWPGWSYKKMWGRHFVGGDGKVLELSESTYQNDGVTQRMLGRTGHLDEWGESNVQNVRLRLHRGDGSVNAETPPQLRLRALRDNKKYTRWVSKSLGLAGQRDMVIEFGPMGFANTWQFEWMVTDNIPVEVVTMEAQVVRAEKS
jgi:hypothetical protein